MNDKISQLRKMLEGIDFCMLTTVSDGKLHSRPMSTQELDEDGNLWFFTSDQTRKAREIDADNRVNVAYSDPEKNTYVSVFGRGELVNDRQKMEELWSPAHKAWFPDGLDTPDIALIRVSVEEAEYWDAPSSKLVQLAGFVKALVTGTEADYGDHGKVRL
jgi:general stress protein 26